MRRSALVALFAIIAILAACSEQTPSDSAAASGSVGESASESASAEPTESAVASEIGGLPSFELPQSAPELAALLPDEIGGAPAFKLSMSGEELLAAGGDSGIDPATVAFLERLDAQPEDISFAIAASTGGESTTGVFAFRVEGADPNQLEQEFQAAMAEEEAIDWAPASVGGKDVLTAADSDNPGNAFYVYTREDVIFIVNAPSQEEAAEILTELP
jgi:hypothetical protein